jgi:hypothetical protein
LDKGKWPRSAWLFLGAWLLATGPACNLTSPAFAPAVPATARVVDSATGAPVTRGRVVLDSPAGASFTATLTSDGVLQIPANLSSGQLIVDAPGYLRYVSNFNSGELPSPWQIRLERAPQTPFLGTVVDTRNGTSVTRGEVRWEGSGGPVVGELTSQGTFRLEVPIAGDAASGRLLINAPGFQPDERAVELRRGQAPMAFRLTALPPTPTPTPIPPPPTATPTPEPTETPAPTSTPLPTPTRTPTPTDG